MCGIIGIIGNHQIKDILTLREKIFHRGPDGFGIYHDEVISLGHTRLAVLDPTVKGNQPMISEDGNFAIIYNGEIYNHQEIRKELVPKYNFKSTSDTETLLYGFIEYGKEILNKLNGIFSFAIYNKSKGEVFIARDPLGVKPLYYFHKDNNFIFGSEIKSFIDHPDFDKTIDHSSLVNYLNFGWNPDESTPFKHVKKLLPGHYVELNVQKIKEYKIAKYYDIPFTGKYSGKSEQDLLDELEITLIASVKRQMLSDVPVGFFLSGGLDSSALVAITRKLYPDRKIQCFTIQTNGLQEAEGFSDDLKYAKQVADYLKVDLEIIEAKEGVNKDFDKMVYHLDEPHADSAALHVLHIAEKAKGMGYKVLISGTGADEVFAGYRRHQALRFEKYFKYTPSFVLKAGKFFVNQLKIKNSFVRRLKKIFINDASDRISRLASYYSVFSLKRNKNLFNSAFQKEIGSIDPSIYFKELLKNIPDEHSSLNHMLYWDMKTYLPNNNLNYTDKLGMAAGVEIRVPFLDIELVKFSIGIPPELKMKGITGKYLLRKLMEKYLPAEVIQRSKTGFGIPPSQLLTKELKPKISEYLSAESIQSRGIFNPDKVADLLRDHSSGKIDGAYPIWCLLAIESWFRQFVDGEK